MHYLGEMENVKLWKTYSGQ